MKKLLLLLAGLVVTTSAAGWFFWPARAPAPAVEAAAPALRLHGSNTVGEKLVPELVRAFLASQGYLLINREQGAEAVEQRLIGTAHPNQPPLAIEIHAHGSSTAFSDLDAGLTDIGMSSRRIKPEENSKLRERYGDLTQPQQEIVLALDALAIIVPPSRALDKLSVAEVAAIFSGEISDWSQLGQAPGAIRLHARDHKSGTWDTFESLVLKPHERKLSASALRYESSEQLNKAVLADPQAIGFVGIGHVDGVKLLAIAKQTGGQYIVPQRHAIGTEDYALSRRLYLYVPANTSNPLAREFITFATSNGGQTIVDRLGQVAYYPTRDKPRVAAQPWPRRYRALGTLAERLSVNFRVENGELVIDGKARRDLQRLGVFFRDNRDKRLVIADIGKPEAGHARSENRAEAQLNTLLGEEALNTHEWVRVEYANIAAAEGQRKLEIWAL